MAEILATIAIVVLMAIMLIAGVQKVKDSGDRATALSQKRQLGSAVFQYAADHDGILPGPLKAGQGPAYIPDAPDQLATALGIYLGIRDETIPTLVTLFIPPAFARAMAGKDLSKTCPFVLNISPKGGADQLKPWGSQAAGSPIVGPAKLARVPVSVWALCDADQKNPAVTGNLASKTPTDIIHGPQRQALYFDGSATSISQNALGNATSPNPPPPPPPPTR